MTVRTTVHLDEDLLVRIRRVVPSRGLSRFINESLAERLDALERQQVAAAMREGYLATRKERDQLNRDWGALDTEGWPE